MSKFVMKDSQELEKYINLDLKEVQKEYSKRLIEILKHIEYENVYRKRAIDYVGYSSENDGQQSDRGFWMYERTKDLYNLFQVTFKGSNQYKSIMSIIPMESKLSHSWEDYQHASPIGDDLSAIEYLNIIENGLPSSKTMFGDEIKPRPFWEEFLEYIDSSHAKKLYETILKQHIKGVYSMGAEIS